MKYSINHPWKFESWWGAFNVGLFQFCILVMVEFVSLMVLLLQQTVLDVLMNFLALTIITEFDDYLFQTLYKDPISRLISDGEAHIGGKHRELSDILTIETTTSWYARFKIDGNRFGRRPDEEEEEGDDKLSVPSPRMLDRDSRASWAEKSVFRNDVPPNYIYISLRERSWGNIICRCIYSFARCFNVVLMFYFAP